MSSSALALHSPSNRARVTNARMKKGALSAKALFVSADGRSPWARRYRDLVAQLASDAGGIEALSELKLSLVRRAAALTLECERMEDALASGKSVDVDTLARVAGHLRRICETIGIDRAARQSKTTIADIAARHAAKGAAA